RGLGAQERSEKYEEGTDAGDPMHHYRHHTVKPPESHPSDRRFFDTPFGGLRIIPLASGAGSSACLGLSARLVSLKRKAAYEVFAATAPQRTQTTIDLKPAPR